MMAIGATPLKKPVERAFAGKGPVTLASVPDALAGKVLADLALANPRVGFVARDGQRLQEVARTTRFFAPGVDILELPAWDCLPYDRVSPHAAVVARRMATLAALQRQTGTPQVVLITVNAALQRVPTRDFIARGALAAAVGNQIRMDDLVHWLEDNGFLRSTTVREPGEYAVRGGILDLFAAGAEAPVRLDFFGETVESIRNFDQDSQRTTTARKGIELVPVNEMVLSPETIARFRQSYVALFGVADRSDLLYHTVSEGRRYVGMEHWLGLFADALETVFDHLGDAAHVEGDHRLSERHRLHDRARKRIGVDARNDRHVEVGDERPHVRTKAQHAKTVREAQLGRERPTSLDVIRTEVLRRVAHDDEGDALAIGRAHSIEGKSRRAYHLDIAFAPQHAPVTPEHHDVLG